MTVLTVTGKGAAVEGAHRVCAEPGVDEGRAGRDVHAPGFLCGAAFDAERFVGGEELFSRSGGLMEDGFEEDGGWGVDGGADSQGAMMCWTS